MLLASGGLSHRFWPFRERRQHEGAGLEHMISPAATAAATAADQRLIARLEAGDHAAVIDGYDDFRAFSPEGKLGHHLMMIGALGGRGCTLPGVCSSDYESAAGAGQVHVWFDCG